MSLSTYRQHYQTLTDDELNAAARGILTLSCQVRLNRHQADQYTSIWFEFHRRNRTVEFHQIASKAKEEYNRGKKPIPANAKPGHSSP
jgi:hypothetical protein